MRIRIFPDLTALFCYCGNNPFSEAKIQKNDRHVEQINLFVRICPGIWRITEIFLFLFGADRCNGNFGGSGKPDDLKYSIYSYGYYTVKMENTL